MAVVLLVVVWMFYRANAREEKHRNRVDRVVYQISKPLERAFIAVFKSWMGVWRKYMYRVDLKKENERLEQENAALAANNHYLAAVAERKHQETAAIGFYFAKLWYYERLYPQTFVVAALGRAVRQLSAEVPPQTDDPL